MGGERAETNRTDRRFSVSMSFRSFADADAGSTRTFCAVFRLPTAAGRAGRPGASVRSFQNPPSPGATAAHQLSCSGVTGSDAAYAAPYSTGRDPPARGITTPCSAAGDGSSAFIVAHSAGRLLHSPPIQAYPPQRMSTEPDARTRKRSVRL